MTCATEVGILRQSRYNFRTSCGTYGKEVGKIQRNEKVAAATLIPKLNICRLERPIIVIENTEYIHI